MGGITRAAIAGLAAFLLTGATGAGAADSLIVPLSSLATDAVQLLPSDQGADIYGVGGGKANNFTGTIKFDMSAHEGPNGDFGHVSVTYYTLTGQFVASYSTDVTCVNIHNSGLGTPYDSGVVRGTIKSITPFPNIFGLSVGSVVDFGIKDGGNPSSGPVDDFFAPSAQGSPDYGCKAFTYPGGLNNVTQGNVNVKGP